MSSNLKPETLKNLSDFLSGGPKEDGASKDGPGTGEKGKS